jgi:hydroxypyruvate reductase
VTEPAPRFAEHRRHVSALRAAALRAVEPAAAVARWLRPEDYAGAEHVYVVGAGKAGVAMAAAAAAQLGERLTAGVLSVPSAPVAPLAAPALECVVFIEGGHPQPTEGTLHAGRALAALLSRATERDLVLALISGGASALLELLRPGLTLADLQATNTALLRSGAAIHEVNTVRTRLSQIKGGGLARLARPARVLALILSDVVGNPLPIIGSGPTVSEGAPHPGAALAIVEKYGLRAQLPPAVLRQLAQGSTGPLAEEAPVVENRLIGSSALAGEAAREAARGLGFTAEWLGDDWQGEAHVVGERLAALVVERRAQLRRARRGGTAALGARSPQCLLAGGETTVTVRGPGRGGRNQEVALAAALALAGVPEVAVASLATDGIDGPTDASGAVVTGATVGDDPAMRRTARQHLDDNDSYAFLQSTGALVVTGATGTNVGDLLIGLVY